MNPNIPSVPFTEENIVDVAEVNQRCCLEESGQWLENVECTHLILASAKLVLQKRNESRQPGVYFAGSSVVGGSEAPHPVVRGPVSSFNVEDKVLDEGDLILT